MAAGTENGSTQSSLGSLRSEWKRSGASAFHGNLRKHFRVANDRSRAEQEENAGARIECPCIGIPGRHDLQNHDGWLGIVEVAVNLLNSKRVCARWSGFPLKPVECFRPSALQPVGGLRLRQLSWKDAEPIPSRQWPGFRVRGGKLKSQILSAASIPRRAPSCQRILECIPSDTRPPPLMGNSV